MAVQDKPLYGATPDTWTHFELVLELTDDLLPVVSNPHAVKSPDSKIQGPGKTPSDYNKRGQMRGFAEWTSYRATSADLAKWSKEPDFGICIQTRTVRAIDVDVDDMEEAVDIEAFIESRTGLKLPARRRGNSSKFLLAFKMPGEFTKRRFKTEKGVIEFLATGQQFVADGTHTSGVRYEWDGGLPDNIPELDPAEFNAPWAALNERFGTEESAESRRGITSVKKRQLADMADPLVAFMEDHLWVKDINRDGRVDITCPFESEHTTDSGDSATSYYPAGVGGFDQGHFKCQHSHCAHRTDQDFKDAMGWSIHGMEIVEEEPEEPPTIVTISSGAPREVKMPPVPTEFKSDAHRTKDGSFKANRIMLNAAIGHPGYVQCEIAYDTFRDEIVRIDLNVTVSRPFRDDDYFDLALHLEKNHGFQHVPNELMRDAVRYVAQRKHFDSALHWLSNLPAWDGVPRVATFLRDYFGAEDTEYTRAVARYFWSGLVGRVKVPGIKADMVPIAVGKQGARKTSLIAAIVPEHDMFLELDLSKKDDDLAREMRGKLLCELAELKGISAKQVEHIKAFISRRREEWTPKFKEFTTRYMRRCMSFGSTNEDEPLPDDDTGQRRWLPFRCNDNHKGDVEKLIQMRNQLWAEAAVLFSENGVLWQEAERLAPTIHKEFEKEDSWTARIEQWVFNGDMGDIAPVDKEGGLRLIDVIEHALSIRIKDVTMTIERRVGKGLKQAGLRKTVRNGHKVWVRK